MKKRFVFWLLSIYFVFNMQAKAVCDDATYKELSTFATHVNHNYIFNYDTYSFSLNIRNLADKLYVQYNDQKYYPENGEVVINNLYSGNSLFVKIYANECEQTSLKSFIINLPYYNNFYNSYKCIGHEDLSVCNSEFLNVQLTSELFDKYIENDTLNKMESNKTDVKDEADEDGTLIDLELIIKIVMVLLGTLIPSIIGTIVYKKIKYKF